MKKSEAGPHTYERRLTNSYEVRQMCKKVMCGSQANIGEARVRQRGSEKGVYGDVRLFWIRLQWWSNICLFGALCRNTEVKIKTEQIYS